VYPGVIAVTQNERITAARMLNKTKAHGFKVDLLFGGHAWTLPASQHIAIDLAQTAVNFVDDITVVCGDCHAAHNRTCDAVTNNCACAAGHSGWPNCALPQDQTPPPPTLPNAAASSRQLFGGVSVGVAVAAFAAALLAATQG
jgi:hypothetical protein